MSPPPAQPSSASKTTENRTTQPAEASLQGGFDRHVPLPKAKRSSVNAVYATPVPPISFIQAQSCHSGKKLHVNSHVGVRLMYSAERKTAENRRHLQPAERDVDRSLLAAFPVEFPAPTTNAMFVLCPGTIMMLWQSPARLGTRGPQRSASVWMPIGCV